VGGGAIGSSGGTPGLVGTSSRLGGGCGLGGWLGPGAGSPGLGMIHLESEAARDVFQKHQNQNHDQYKAQKAAGSVAPVTAVTPGG
jgi:hypothetical protein